jgi:hypothetical protein
MKSRTIRLAILVYMFLREWALKVGCHPHTAPYPTMVNKDVAWLLRLFGIACWKASQFDLMRLTAKESFQADRTAGLGALSAVPRWGFELKYHIPLISNLCHLYLSYPYSSILWYCAQTIYYSVVVLSLLLYAVKTFANHHYHLSLSAFVETWYQLHHGFPR